MTPLLYRQQKLAGLIYQLKEIFPKPFRRPKPYFSRKAVIFSLLKLLVVLISSQCRMTHIEITQITYQNYKCFCSTIQVFSDSTHNPFKTQKRSFLHCNIMLFHLLVFCEHKTCLDCLPCQHFRHPDHIIVPHISVWNF